MTTLSQLTEAHYSLSSLLHKCEKSGEKLIPGTPQKTLITRRIEALHLALGLIDQQIKQTKE